MLTMGVDGNATLSMPPYAGLFAPGSTSAMRPPRYGVGATNGGLLVAATPPLRPNEDAALRAAKEQRRARARKVYSSEEEEEEEDDEDGVYGLVSSLKV